MTTSVSSSGNSPQIFRFADLPKRKPTPFNLQLTESHLAEIMQDLCLQGLRKVRMTGEVSPVGKADWHLYADLGATVVQPCVVTLEPVTTRIEDQITRDFLANWQPPEGVEVEMPDDTNTEALPDTLDLRQLFVEALALSLPPYPRVSDADLGTRQFTEPGKTPMTDDDAKPFAGLAKLKLVEDRDTD